MKKSRSKQGFVKCALHILGLSLCTLPPVICTLCYFPLWKSSAEKTISGSALLLLLLCLLPLFKDIKARISSAAGYTLWLILFVLFYFLSRIADEMSVIAFFGFIGNLLGSLCFYLKRRGDSAHED